MPNINGGERTSEKRKRVTRPASLSPLNPATALGSLLSVALSSVTAKSIYMIPSVAICVNVQPRRHGCTVFSDGGVQFTPTTLFSFKRRRCSTTPLYSFLYQMDLPHRAVAVYVYLYDRANKNGECWPSVSTIAKEIKLSQATVRRAIKDLRKAGLIETTQRYRTKGGTSTLLLKLKQK